MRRPVLAAVIGLLLLGAASTADALVVTYSGPASVPVLPWTLVATGPFSGWVGTLSPCAGAADYAATVDWGDGQRSEGTVVPTSAGGSCNIRAAHTYAQVPETRNFDVTVTATPTAGGAAKVSTFSVRVTPWQLTGGPPVKSTDPHVADWQLFNFPASNAGPWDQVIDWGDGTVDTSSTFGFPTRFEHQFPGPGVYTVTLRLLVGDEEKGRVVTRAVISNCGNAIEPVPAPPVRVAGTPDVRWVTAVYFDLVGASPDAQAVRTWTSELANGAPRSQIVRAIQATSGYAAARVADAYHALLGRDPSPEELAAGPGTAEAAVETVALMPEYTLMLRSTDVDRFANTLVCDVLHTWRPPPQIASAVQAGDRAAVVRGLLSSSAYRAAITQTTLRTMLRLALPDSASRQVRRQLKGVTSAAGAEQIVGASQDYFAQMTADPSLADIAIGRSGLIRGRLMRDASLQLVVADAHGHRIGTVALGEQRRGAFAIRWSRTVGPRTLRGRRYRLILEALRGQRVVDATDALSWQR